MTTSHDPSTTAYDVDPDRSSVRFRAIAFGLIPVNGILPVEQGTVLVSGSTVQGSGELAANRVDTRMAPRDWHLRTKHYLHSAEHPRVAVALEQADVSRAEQTCSVTVRGVTHPVPVRVSRFDHDRAELHATLATTLDRTPFPMLPLLAGVSRRVELEIDLVGVAR